MTTTRPTLQGSFGMVASTHWLASAVGMGLLERGHTAVDAAAAAGFTLQVAEPHLNGPGGDLPLILARPGAEPVVLCAQGVAPQAATAAHYRDLGLELIPGSGPLAAVVPGATPGWLTLVRDHGTASLRDVTEAAIHYAERGVPLLPQIAATIDRVAPLFRDDWTTSAATYLGDARTPGGLLRNPVWAGVLRRLVTEAEAASSDREAQLEQALRSWSGGFVAEAIEAFARLPFRDSSGERHAGLLTGADLAAWTPTYEPPATLDFAGWTVCKTAAWGQGPVLLQQLALLDGLAPGTDLVSGDGELVHRVVEGAKLAFADREAWYGDAADVPLAALLSPAYTDGRRVLIGERADGELRPGAPDGRAPRLPGVLGSAGTHGTADVTTAEPTVSGADAPGVQPSGQTRGDTCHVDVVDRWGTMVSATPSGGWLQSSPVVEGLGFPLGSRLQMAWLEQGLPNSLTPGRRPRTTLSPSVALRDGRPALAFGTPGGDQQDQWQLGFLLHHVVGGLDLQEAIEAPAFHTTHVPSSFYPHEAFPRQVVVEDRVGADVIAGLRARGHEVVVAGPWTLGRLSAVSRDPDGVLRAGANPRGGQGYAVGR